MSRLLRIVAFALLFLSSCAVPRDTTRLEWLPHAVEKYVTTPAGHQRDAGPFTSVERGFASDVEIDAAVDAGYARFHEVFADLKLKEHKVAINDDYAMWCVPPGMWVSGFHIPGQDVVHVTLWSRAESLDLPPQGIHYIVRPPGEYWGQSYPTYRSTAKPLVPALVHELLHTVIGDPNHTDPRWSLVN